MGIDGAVDAVEVVVAPGNDVADLDVGDDDGVGGCVDTEVFGAEGVDVEATRDVVVVAGARVVDGTDFSVVGDGFAIGAVGPGTGAGRTST